MPEGLKVEVLLEDTKYQDNLMKKYKLKDLVSNGSHSSREVRSNVLVGDIDNGYGYGDILDANATQQVADSIAENKVNIAKQELITRIQELEGGSNNDYSEMLLQLESLQNKNNEQDEQDAAILEQIQNILQRLENNTPTIGGDNDNLIFS